MTSAQLHSLDLGTDESLLSLQLRLEAQTQAHISPQSQELLLETGNSLDPRRPPIQFLPEGLVCSTERQTQAKTAFVCRTLTTYTTIVYSSCTFSSAIVNADADKFQFLLMFFFFTKLTTFFCCFFLFRAIINFHLPL